MCTSTMSSLLGRVIIRHRRISSGCGSIKRSLQLTPHHILGTLSGAQSWPHLLQLQCTIAK